MKENINKPLFDQLHRKPKNKASADSGNCIRRTDLKKPGTHLLQMNLKPD